MTTTKLAEALRRLIDASMVAMTDQELATGETLSAWEDANEALASYEAEAKPEPAVEYQRGWDECMALWADHMKRMNEALEKPLPGGYGDHTHHLYQNVRGALNAAPLEATPEAKPAPEPFGYVSEHNCEGPYQWQFHKTQAGIYWDNCKGVTTVYAAPAAPARVPEIGFGNIKPLTDEQIDEMAHKEGDYDERNCCWSFNGDTQCRYNLTNFARAIEQAHGIAASKGDEA